MVFMTHNTDIGDSWEREADDPTFFYTFGVPGYAFGINVLLVRAHALDVVHPLGARFSVRVHVRFGVQGSGFKAGFEPN